MQISVSHEVRFLYYRATHKSESYFKDIRGALWWLFTRYWSTPPWRINTLFFLCVQHDRLYDHNSAAAPAQFAIHVVHKVEMLYFAIYCFFWQFLIRDKYDRAVRLSPPCNSADLTLRGVHPNTTSTSHPWYMRCQVKTGQSSGFAHAVHHVQLRFYVRHTMSRGASNIQDGAAMERLPPPPGSAAKVRQVMSDEEIGSLRARHYQVEIKYACKALYCSAFLSCLCVTSSLLPFSKHIGYE